MDQTQLFSALAGHAWQPLLTVLPCTISTNADCKAAARANAPEGTAYLAEQQTGGRGRLGRSFFSPPDCGIYLSVLLRPKCPPEALLPLTAFTAVAACDAVAQCCGLRPQIKWPNDLILQGRKIAGILTEPLFFGKECAVVIGIGVNCNQRIEDFPPDLRERAGSLRQCCGAPVSREQLAAALLREFSLLPDALGRARGDYLKRFSRDCITIGRQIAVLFPEQPRTALALGIDENAALRVRYEDGTEALLSCGEVSVRGLY